MNQNDIHSSESASNPLEFTYSERTSDVEIQVRPAYMALQSRPDQHMFTWSYQVTITNHGARRLQVLNRHWIITDGRGIIDEVQGAGVIGEQPVILPGQFFTYTSGCPLRTPTGNMRGWYECVDLDTREKIKVRIPLFFLRSHETLH